MTKGCRIDEKRPCNSKNRKPNRYTRKELDDIAEKCGIKDIKNKTMDELCQLIRELSKKEPSLIQTIFEPLPEDKGGIYNGAQLKKLTTNTVDVEKLFKTHSELVTEISKKEYIHIDEIGDVFEIYLSNKSLMLKQIFQIIFKKIHFTKKQLTEMSQHHVIMIGEVLDLNIFGSKEQIIDLIIKSYPKKYPAPKEDYYTLSELKHLKSSDLDIDKMYRTRTVFLFLDLPKLNEIGKEFGIKKTTDRMILLRKIFVHVFMKLNFTEDQLKKFSKTDLYLIGFFLNAKLSTNDTDQMIKQILACYQKEKSPPKEDIYTIDELKHLKSSDLDTEKMYRTRTVFLMMDIDELNEIGKEFGIKKMKDKGQIVTKILFTVFRKLDFKKEELEKLEKVKLSSILFFLKTTFDVWDTKEKLIHKIIRALKICSSTSKNAFRPNYYCNEKTGLWIRIKGSPDYYFKTQLEKMDQNKLKMIASGLGIKNAETSKLQLIGYILEAQYPLVASKYKQSDLEYKTVQQLKNIATSINIDIKDDATKSDIVNQIMKKQEPEKYNKYIKKFKDYFLEKLHPTTKKLSSTATYIMNIILCTIPSYSMNSVFTNNKLSYKNNTITIQGSYERNKKGPITNDLTGLFYNNNWFTKQANYQKSLSFNDQLMILAYTYGGDVILHAYIEKRFDIKNAIKPKTYTGPVRYMFPLFPALVKYCSDVKNKKEFMDLFFITKTDNEKKALWDLCHDHPYNNYVSIVENIFEKYIMRNLFYKKLVKIFYHELNRIILKSPPLEHSLIVYKGIKTPDFLQFDKNNIYKNKRFISTSFKYETAKSSSFMDISSHCCLLKIYLIKGTRCMYPLFSFFKEFEILLPTDRYLYATSKLEPRSVQGVQIKTMDLVIAN